MESGELIAVLIVVIILLVGTIFLCFRCWRAIGEVADDHMKPKRETRAQMIRGAVRRSFRRAGTGIQRGAGAVRNSFRRARGIPPTAPPPEEPGPPTRPYGSRGGARRYPGRPGHHPGGPAPGGPRSPGQAQPVPSVSAQTVDGPGHSDIHPSYLPKGKRPTSTGSQSDAPPTYQEALHHETAASRATAAHSHHGNVEVHKSPPRTSGPPPPQRLPSAPSETPPPIPPAPYPEQLGVQSGYPSSSHGMPVSRYSQHEPSRGMPQSPQDAPHTPRGIPHSPQGGYPAGYPGQSPQASQEYPRGYPGQSPHTPVQRSPYQQSATPSRDDPNRDYRGQDLSPGYNPQFPHPAPSAQSYDRDRRQQSREYQRDYASGDSQREPSYDPGYSRSRSQESREFPHLMTSHPSRDNEYSQPPVPARNYSLDDDDDGGFVAQSSRNRRVVSSSNVPRDYVDYRSHDQFRGGRPSGEDEVDYAGYAQIPPRSVRNAPYSPTSGSYQNEAYVGDTRQPGDGAYVGQGQSQGQGNSSYYTQRGPLPPVPHHPDPRIQAQYNTQQGVAFPATDRRHMDSDTYI